MLDDHCHTPYLKRKKILKKKIITGPEVVFPGVFLLNNIFPVFLNFYVTVFDGNCLVASL